MKTRCGGCFRMYDDKYDICPYCGYYTDAPAKEPYFLTPGMVLANRYVIGNVLGFGGFGITYKAWDKKLESVVAVKEYYPSGIVNRTPGTSQLIMFSGVKKKEFEYGLVRFIDEARNMTKFNTHKNIVNVYEYLEENNTAYIIMEFLDGCTLGEYMESNGGKLPLDQSIEIIMAIGNALKDVHENEIIHRDISPDNIFMCNDGTIKLIDFGAARFSSEEVKNFTIILKPGFAPPEQYEQISDQGPKTDIYALGATLYYMVTGVKPDESTNRKIKDILVEPNKLDPSIPQYVSDSILKAMAIEPHLRFNSVDEFEKSLKQEIKVVSIKKEKRIKKTKRFVGIMSLLLVLSGVATLFFANVKKQNENVTLEPAAITIWYPGVDGDKTDEAYTSLVKAFCDEYKEVKVNISCIPESEYYTKLDEAIKNGKAPNLFISNDLSYTALEGAYDLSDVIYPADSQSGLYFLIRLLSNNNANTCYFLNKYDSLFENHKQMPTSFNVPVLYVNTKYVHLESDTVSSFKDIENYIGQDSKIVINNDMKDTFTRMFNKGVEENIIKGTKEQFMNGDAAFYFSDSSEYYDIRNMMKLNSNAGQPQYVRIDVSEIPCTYGDLWSVWPGDDAQNAASVRLLDYFLTDKAQSTLYGKSDMSRSLPINKESFARWSDTIGDLAFIKDMIKACVFA